MIVPHKYLGFISLFFFIFLLLLRLDKFGVRSAGSPMGVVAGICCVAHRVDFSSQLFIILVPQFLVAPFYNFPLPVFFLCSYVVSLPSCGSVSPSAPCAPRTADPSLCRHVRRPRFRRHGVWRFIILTGPCFSVYCSHFDFFDENGTSGKTAAFPSLCRLVGRDLTNELDCLGPSHQPGVDVLVLCFLNLRLFPGPGCGFFSFHTRS